MFLYITVSLCLLCPIVSSSRTLIGAVPTHLFYFPDLPESERWIQARDCPDCEGVCDARLDDLVRQLDADGGEVIAEEEEIEKGIKKYGSRIVIEEEEEQDEELLRGGRGVVDMPVRTNRRWRFFSSSTSSSSNSIVPVASTAQRLKSRLLKTCRSRMLPCPDPIICPWCPLLPDPVVCPSCPAPVTCPMPTICPPTLPTRVKCPRCKIPETLYTTTASPTLPTTTTTTTTTTIAPEPTNDHIKHNVCKDRLSRCEAKEAGLVNTFRVQLEVIQHFRSLLLAVRERRKEEGRRGFRRTKRHTSDGEKEEGRTWYTILDQFQYGFLAGVVCTLAFTLYCMPVLCRITPRDKGRPHHPPYVRRDRSPSPTIPLPSSSLPPPAPPPAPSPSSSPTASTSSTSSTSPPSPPTPPLPPPFPVAYRPSRPPPPYAAKVLYNRSTGVTWRRF